MLLYSSKSSDSVGEHDGKSSAIVLIPGFLSPTSTHFSKPYWGSANQFNTTTSPIITVTPSGVASLHDRCCDIFAQLTGTRVNYGKKHSQFHGHSQYGQTYKTPLLKNWNAANPIHLVGHSFGGTTARWFHHMLSSGQFGVNYTSDCVLSISTINAPNNGALSVYCFGGKCNSNNPSCSCSSPSTSTSSSSSSRNRTEHVLTWSIGWLLGMYVHLHNFFSFFYLNSIYNFGMSQWSSSLYDTLYSIFIYSSMFEGQDCANYDMTVHRAIEMNLQIPTNPNTFYFSIVGNTKSTMKHSKKNKNKKYSEIATTKDTGAAAATTCTSIKDFLLYCFGRCFMFIIYLSTWYHYNRITDNMNEKKAQEWMASGSDGLVTVKSQSYPLIDANMQEPSHCNLATFKNNKNQNIKPGTWYVHHVNGHHLETVPFPKSQATQYNLFKGLFNTLRKLPPKKRKY